MAKREFVMLAHPFKPEKHYLMGALVSEKLDGMRCIWLPFTRGLKKSEVPFANNDKDDRLLEDQVCTGLWSRLGNVIHAPDYWLDGLPNLNLDGELYSEDLIRQDLMSTVKKLPKNCVDSDWDPVKLFAFDSPYLYTIFADGVINTTNFKKTFKGLVDWAINLGAKSATLGSPSFMAVQRHLKNTLSRYPRTHHVEQIHLPTTEAKAREVAFKMLDEVTDRGGEGLMVRVKFSNYACERSHNLFKLKKLDDDDGQVIGYITGRKTDLGSKLLGKMGAVILRLDNGNHLELSGFTEHERRLEGTCPDSGITAEEWACCNPEKATPAWITVPHLPIYDIVSFRFRGLSRAGIPNEARYWRKRLDD